MHDLPKHIKKWILSMPDGSYLQFMKLYRDTGMTMPISKFFRELHDAAHRRD